MGRKSQATKDAEAAGKLAKENPATDSTVEDATKLNEKILKCATACHEANKKHCLSIGDESQRSWNDAPEWQKQSAIDGVGFYLKNPDVSPEQQHISWMESKIKDGWKYGQEKDESKKTHPCMIDYNNLPAEQKEKDEIFIKTIKLTMAEISENNELTPEAPANEAGPGPDLSDTKPEIENKKNPKSLFFMGFLGAVDVDMDPLDIAKDAHLYADEMLKLSDGDDYRDGLAMMAMPGFIRVNETPEITAKTAFLIADEIINLNK